MEKFTNDATSDSLQAEARAEAARILGSIKSAKKAKASRENGKKGGRPAEIGWCKECFTTVTSKDLTPYGIYECRNCGYPAFSK